MQNAAQCCTRESGAVPEERAFSNRPPLQIGVTATKGKKEIVKKLKAQFHPCCLAASKSEAFEAGRAGWLPSRVVGQSGYAGRSDRQWELRFQSQR